MKKYISYNYLKGILLLILAFAVTGCTPAYTPPDYSQYYWPREPQKTRLRLLNIIKTDLDVRNRASTEMLFGATSNFSMKKPHGIALDNESNIYVTDAYMRNVFIINQDTGATSTLKKPGHWTAPSGIGIDKTNNLLAVADMGDVFIFNYKTRQLLLTLTKATNDFVMPQGLAFDPKNNYIYIGDTRASKIYKYDYKGNKLATIAEKGGGKNQVYYPGMIATDDKGRLFVVDTMNWKLKIWGPDGELISSFGEHGRGGGKFSRAKGIAVSKDGVIAITENDFNYFMLMNDQGQAYFIQGGASNNAPGNFVTPMGIAFDDDDKIYVVDQTNRRIQVFQMYTDKYYEEHPEEIPKVDLSKQKSLIKDNEDAIAEEGEQKPEAAEGEPKPATE